MSKWVSMQHACINLKQINQITYEAHSGRQQKLYIISNTLSTPEEAKTSMNRRKHDIPRPMDKPQRISQTVSQVLVVPMIQKRPLAAMPGLYQLEQQSIDRQNKQRNRPEERNKGI